MLRKTDPGRGRPNPASIHELYRRIFGHVGGRQDRTPNRLAGVGFCAQGFETGGYYLRKPDSFNPRADFIFEGLSANETIGDFGIAGGGAAGQELDRYDVSLGSPQHALVVASSEGITGSMLLAKEEMEATHPMIDGDANPYGSF